MSDSVMRKIENINCETESIEESWTGTGTEFLLKSGILGGLSAPKAAEADRIASTRAEKQNIFYMQKYVKICSNSSVFYNQCGFGKVLKRWIEFTE